MKVEINSFADWLALTEKVRKRFQEKKSPLYVTLEPNKKRSDPQNKYLWGVAYPTIVNHSPGLTAKGRHIEVDHVHEVCKKGFLDTSDAVLINGLFAEYTGSTRNLTTAEFNDYVTKMQAHFAEYGIIIPNPNEVL